MLVEALDALGADDVLVLDRGYPAAWLVQMLEQRGIRFVMRCDSGSGWPAVREFMRGSSAEARLTLSAPTAADAQDWGCARQAPSVRVVRCVAPNGSVRVLATNVEAARMPAAAFAELYHQRWRIEEAFKRLKHRLHLEAVSGLSQQALIVDVAAKVLADNIAALLCSLGAGRAPARGAHAALQSRLRGPVRAAHRAGHRAHARRCHRHHRAGIASARIEHAALSPRPVSPSNAEPRQASCALRLQGVRGG